MDPFSLTQNLLSTIFEEDLSGMVVTIIGAAGSGKTTLSCMQVPLYLIKCGSIEDGKILIINTDRSLLNKRFLEVCREFGYSYKDIRDYLVFKGFDNFNDQHYFITNELISLINKGLKLRYIVVDAFNYLLRELFNKTEPDKRLLVMGQNTPKLGDQMRVLLNLSRKYKIPVVLTVFPKKDYANQIPNEWHKGFMGPIDISHLSDIVTWFIPRGSRVECNLLKHRLKPAPKKFMLEITKFGLKLA